MVGEHVQDTLLVGVSVVVQFPGAGYVEETERALGLMRGWVQGRVIFSLRELEKGETWYTENRNSVRRISDTHVLLGGTNHTTHGAVYTTTLPTHAPRRRHAATTRPIAAAPGGAPSR
jgi:hypothetical protein